MDNMAECLWERNNHTAKRFSPAEASGFDHGIVPGRHGDGMPLPREKASQETKGALASEPKSGPAKLTGNLLAAPANLSGSGTKGAEVAANPERIPEGVRASMVLPHGEYDARRLRSQREVIRDVMLAAADCETWLTLGELRALTRYGEASISAQLRHLRKAENGGYEVIKRHREGASPERPGTDGRGECVWEYRISREMRTQETARSAFVTGDRCFATGGNLTARACAVGPKDSVFTNH